MDKEFSTANFKPGTVVVFDPESFHPAFWDTMSEKDKIKYYGHLGYGRDKPKFFVFLCEISTLDRCGSGHCGSGHCVLVSLSDQKIETMIHINDFRAVTEEEF